MIIFFPSPISIIFLSVTNSTSYLSFSIIEVYILDTLFNNTNSKISECYFLQLIWKRVAKKVGCDTQIFQFIKNINRAKVFIFTTISAIILYLGISIFSLKNIKVFFKNIFSISFISC